MRRKLPFPEKDRECARANGKHSLETRLKVNEASLVAFGTFMYPHWRNSYHRALEKVDKQQLNRKWFEIYQTKIRFLKTDFKVSNRSIFALKVSKEVL